VAHYDDKLIRMVGELNRLRTPEAAEFIEETHARQSDGALTILLGAARADRASDVILVAGSPPALRVHGKLKRNAGPALADEDVRGLMLPLLSNAEYSALQRDRSVDLAFDVDALGRFRANLHYQRGTLAATIRLLQHELPTLKSLNLPETIGRLAALRQGLVLVTGPTGCGKSSTLAAIVDLINNTRECHIVTIEEPIEFQHQNRSAIVEQIEVGRDTSSFLVSLRSILRQSPDVILVGEMRDAETMSTVLTAAETGHLVLSTLHTNDTSQAISRILDSFPAANQPQIRQQLSLAFETIIAQQLVPSADGKSRYPALEIMTGSDAVRSLIRKGQDHQLRSQLLMSRASGMVTMEQSLAELVRAGKISRHSALSHCFRPDELNTLLAD
jgi:twitching motility protein PilT